MRPVNLIPPDERRGERAPSRTGGLAYVVVGVLAIALLAVVGIVLTDNQISDSEAQVTELKAEVDQATREANRLKSYADFASIEQSRMQTVSTLAKSRFDWYRVFRELALVIPDDVWLTGLEGTVSPTATTPTGDNTGSSADFSTQITGPSLSIQGCADGHDAVAGFMGALRDIDGVTRVVVTSSERQSNSTAGSGGAAPGGTGCEARDFISKFEIVVAFDKVKTDPATGLAPAEPVAPVSSPAANPAPTGSDGSGVAGVLHQEAKQRASEEQQSAKAHQAVSNLIPGTVAP